MRADADDLSLNDEAAVEYASKHDLHNLIDMLIMEVAGKKSRNPVSYMADVLQKRIAKREERYNDTLLAATLTSLSEADGDGCRAVSVDGRGQSLSRFGIWVHITYNDLPAIVSSFMVSVEKVLASGEEIPQDFVNNKEFLLQMLATASATEHYKGFDEAIKFVPLRHHKHASRACELLLESVLDHAPLATPSQRRSFIAFMRRVASYLHEISTLDNSAVIKNVWQIIRTTPRYWEGIREFVQKQHRQSDPIAAMEVQLFDTFADIIDRVIKLLPKLNQIHKEVIEPTYLQVTSTSTSHILPDRFVLHAALFYRGLEVTVDRDDFTPVAAELFEDLFVRLIEIVNQVTSDCLSNSHRRVRRGTASLFRALRRFIGNDTYRRHRDTAEGRMLFAEYLTGFHGYTDGSAIAFISVAQAILGTPRKFFDNESYAMRCNAEAHRTMLRLLVALVHFRSAFTVNEVLLFVVRCRGFGVSPTNLFVYFAESFSVAGDDTITLAEREEAKQVLVILQDVCLAAYRTPMMEELAKSLKVFARSIDAQNIAEHMTSISIANRAIPAETLAHYLEIETFLNELIRAFGTSISATPGYFQDHVFRSYSLMTARLQGCHIMMTGTCDFVPMSLLSLSDDTSSSMSVYSLLPAMEVFLDLSHALNLTTYVHSSAYDRSVLLAHFQPRMTSRLLILAIEDFLQTFPQYSERLSRPSISFETLQCAFTDLLMALLKSSPADMTERLREVAVTLSVWGVLPQDYDLFGPSLERVMQAPNFPHAEWGGFYRDVVDTLVSLSPPVPDVREYSSDNIATLVRAQAYGRRYIVQRRLRIERQTKLFELRKILRDSMNEGSYGDIFNNATADSGLTNTDKKVVYLSWNMLDEDTRTLLLFRAIHAAPAFRGTRSEVEKLFGDTAAAIQLRNYNGNISPSTGSPSKQRPAHEKNSSFLSKENQYKDLRSQNMEALENCRTVTSNFNSLIAVLWPSDESLTSPAGRIVAVEESWVMVWREVFGGSIETFFDKQLSPEHLRSFGTLLVEGINSKVQVTHPGIRVAWVAFLGDLYHAMES